MNNIRIDIVTIESNEYGSVTFDDSSGFHAHLSTQAPLLTEAKPGQQWRVTTNLDTIWFWGEIIAAELITEVSDAR